MNILFINNFFVGFMVSEIPRVIFLITFPYKINYEINLSKVRKIIKISKEFICCKGNVLR